MRHARRDAPSGATICVRSGNYGSFEETRPPRIAKAQVIRAEDGQNPTLTNVSIDYASPSDAKLVLSGFTVHATRDVGSVLRVKNAKNLRLNGLDVSAFKWAVGGEGIVGARVESSDDVVIDRTKFHSVHVGMMIQDTNGIRLLNNNVEVTGGSGIRYVLRNRDAEISHNHIHGVDWIPDADSVVKPHASIISFRDGNVIVRGNHMHGMGNSSGVMFYQSGTSAAYNDILFENNVIYDTINIYAMRIYDLGSNVTVRNNVFYPGLEEGPCPDGSSKDSRYRMRNAFIVHNKAAGSPGIKFYNNVVAGALLLGPDDIEEERNNYVWSWFTGSWISRSPSGTSKIVHSTAGRCSHSKVFEDGSFFSAPMDGFFPGTGVYPMDLARSSPGRNFGDPKSDPDSSMGSIGEDGFVALDGPCRDDANHDVGAFQGR